MTYCNLDSARTPVPHNGSMPPTLPSQRELVATDSSAVEDHTNELISSYYIDSDTTEDPILFSQKHLNNLIRDLCISKEKGSSLHHCVLHSIKRTKYDWKKCQSKLLREAQ